MTILMSTRIFTLEKPFKKNPQPKPKPLITSLVPAIDGLCDVATIKRWGPSTYPCHLPGRPSGLYTSKKFTTESYRKLSHLKTSLISFHNFNQILLTWRRTITRIEVLNTLVANTIRCRGICDCFIQRPTYSSLRPCVSALCGTGYLQQQRNYSQ